MAIKPGDLLNITPAYTQGQTLPGVTNNSNSAKPEINTEVVQERLTKECVTKLTIDLNKMLQLLDADLQFAMHEATQRLMVQVVDTKEQKVLKEFPSHELLDVIANIQNHIGVLLDKKA